MDRIDGVRDGDLAVRVAAPPVDGAANAALLRLLSRELDLPGGALRVVGGDRSRRKLIAAQCSRERLAGRWPGLAV